jgi:hypothetical protein
MPTLSDSVTTSAKATLSTLATPPPAVLLATGNVIHAGQHAEPLGVALSSATALAAFGCSVYQRATGQKVGLPFFVLGAVNTATAASVLCEAGIRETLGFNLTAMKALMPAAAFAAWAAGHFINGYREKTGEPAQHLLANEQVWYGIGDIAAVKGNSLPLGIFGLGLTMALRHKKTGETHEEAAPALMKFLKTHVIPARLYGLGYVVGALSTLHEPAFAAAQLFWGAGYAAMPQAENRLFLETCRESISRCMETLGAKLFDRRLSTPAPCTISINSQAPELTGLLSAVDPAANDLLNTDHFLAHVAQRAAQRYRDGASEYKQYAFEVLIDLAGAQNTKAREALVELANQGDPLAKASISNLTSRPLSGAIASQNRI